MARSAEEILELYEARHRAEEPALQQMREIREAYNGDLVIPLPEMEQSEKPSVANLVAEGIDQNAMRIASTMPNIIAPALEMRRSSGTRSREYADVRRKAVQSWWQSSRIRRVQRRRARFLVAYGTAPVHVWPDTDKRIPTWRVRNPLTTYPNPTDTYDDALPVDVIFTYKRSYAWFKDKYPDQSKRLFKGHGWDPMEPESNAKLFRVLEYWDADECVIMVVGEDRDPYNSSPLEPDILNTRYEELERFSNRAGICPVSNPKRISLDRLVGQFNQILGMYMAQAKLHALDMIAVTKAVFPDIALIGQDGQAPLLAGDRWKEGITGEINEITNGQVEVVQLNPGFKTGEALDRLERGMRLHGIAPQFGGENPTNIRTGRAAEIAMSAQVDFRVQEYQETMAEALEIENRIAIATAKGWFGDEPKTFVIGSGRGRMEQVDYIPNIHFETDFTQVVYPMPGSDINGLLLGIANRMATGVLSQHHARELDPLIEDPEWEGDRVMAERLEQAALDGLSQMAAAGAIPPADLAFITKKVLEDNMPLYQAVEEAQRAAQERQAQQEPPGSAPTQPGIATPGSGAEAGVTVPEVRPGLDRLNDILYNLRVPQTPAGGAPAPVAEGATA